MGTMILIAIIALFVIWLIVAYNSLVRSRMHTKESWSQIDVQLKRRNDLIPNLIETVKGYAAYEGKHLRRLQNCVLKLLKLTHLLKQ